MGPLHLLSKPESVHFIHLRGELCRNLCTLTGRPGSSEVDDHIDLYSRYSNVCLKIIKEELNLAEDNYNDMFDKLTKSLSLLATHENHLVKSYNILDQELWDTSNPLTRWNVSPIPANGIFLTKKLKNKNKNAQRVEND